MIVNAILTICVFPATANRQPLISSSQPLPILRIGLNAKDVETLDPHFANENRDRVIAEMMFNRLVRYKPGSATVLEPDLAENIPEPEIVYGKQIWTFTLKKGVLFHPGPNTEFYEMTADDVVFSLNKTFRLVSSTYGGDYSGMAVEKADDYSVRIILEKPMSSALFMPRLAAYSGGFIVSKKAFEMTGYERFKAWPVGTGPFMPETYDPGKKISLKANLQYFRDCPLLEGIDIFFLPDIKERESALKAGTLDIIEGLPESGWIENMEKQEGLTVDLQGIGEVVMLHFNTAAKAIDDIRIRRAIAYTLDRDVFLKNFGNQAVKNIYSPVPEGFLTGGLPLEKIKLLNLDYAPDLNKASQLMAQAEAEYAGGFDLKLVTSAHPIYRKYYESLRDQLAQIGINCKLNPVAHSSMHKRIREGENALVIYIGWRPDADAVLTRFFHSDAMRRGAKPDANFSCYTKADKLIEAARIEVRTAEQVRLWEYAQIKILDHLAAYPIHYIHPVHVRRNYVDYGHETEALAFYPYITELTKIDK
jgi:peptide/nickel transport system substrate-binding protein